MNSTTKNPFGKVAVLYGGNSAERQVSLNSGKAVFEALLEAEIDAHLFDTATESLSSLKSRDFDRAFIALHGRGGEDGSIQGALECMGVPYTGSGVAGSVLSIDKVLTKNVWSAHDIPTAPYRVVNKGTYIAQDCQNILSELSSPVMVKPSLEGSSLGMAKANTESDLDEAIQRAFEFDSQVLVEAFITGDEYTVGVLGDSALPSITMKPASGFYDYEAKYHSTSTEYFCPSGLNEEDEKALQATALKAFSVLKCTGWGRIDAMRSQNGQFYLLENNTVPGMTNTSLVPKAALQAGLSFTDLVVKILSQTLTEQTSIR